MPAAERTHAIDVSESMAGGTMARADIARGVRGRLPTSRRATRPVRAAALDTRGRTLVGPKPTAVRQ